MKNKNVTYLLIAGVVVVWGLIFYRVFSGLDSGEDTVIAMPKRKVIKQTQEKEEEVLVLFANYRDPFLGGTSRAISVTRTDAYGSNTSSIPRKPAVKKEKQEEVPIDWTFLDYVGIVQNKETKKKVGLLTISGKEYMVNEKDQINGVTILRKERDSIQVNYSGKDKWIRR